MKASSGRSRLHTRPPHGTSAAALIITLMFLVLIAVMILAMSDSVRVERGAAGSYINQTMANQMAERGIDHIVATLNKETADINRNWITQPGQLVLGAEQDDTSTPIDERRVLTGAVLDGTNPFASKIVRLHSGTPSGAASSNPVLTPPNLNISTWANPGEHLITEKLDASTGNVVEMRVKWIYVREDGTLETDEAPSLTGTANPIIGRYAFWADDESTKVNLNLAWSRNNPDNTLSQSNPTRISLAALPGFDSDDKDATELHNYVSKDNFKTIKAFFNSPDDARKVSANLSGKIRDNKFDVTHYNHDPQTTFFNEKRIVLTTQKKYAGNNPFIDILSVDNSDPGRITTVKKTSTSGDPVFTEVDVIDEAKVDKFIKLMAGDGTKVGYLGREDWPMVPATAPSKSFQSKYFNNDNTRLAQLAIGIIEYVRSVESEKVIVEPLRVIWDANTKMYKRVTSSLNAGKDGTFIGNPRKFHITEMGLWRAEAPETTGDLKDKLKIRFYIEVHIPANYGIDPAGINLLEPEPGKRLLLYISQADTVGYCFTADGKDAFTENGKNGVGKNSYVVEAKNIAGVPASPPPGDTSAYLKPGEYKTLVFEFYCKVPSPLPSPVTFNLRYALTIAEDQYEGDKVGRFEITPLSSPPGKDGQSIGYPLVVTSSTAPLDSIDPRKAPPLMSSVSTNDPRVNGTPDDWQSNATNTFGTKKASSSVGIKLSAKIPPLDTDAAGLISDASLRTPFPKGHAKNPTGLVMSPAELGFVHTGLEGKAVNNGKGTSWRTIRLQPTTGSTITQVPDWALMDLFTVPADVSTAAAALLSPHGTGAGRININSAVKPFNIDRAAPLEALLLNARNSTTNPTAILSASEAKTIAANIRNSTLAGQRFGYADGFDSPGEIVEIKGIADKGEDSEELVRSISNLITTRSNVFGVYTVGQSIKQTPSGNLLITGEQRQHAIVERYLTTGDKVYFRTVYLRNINP